MSVLFGLLVGLDNFGLGLCVGAAGPTRRSWLPLAVGFGLAEALAPLLGASLGGSSVARLAAAGPVLALGLGALLLCLAVRRADLLRDALARPAAWVIVPAVFAIDNLAAGVVAPHLALVSGLAAAGLAMVGMALGVLLRTRGLSPALIAGGAALAAVALFD